MNEILEGWGDIAKHLRVSEKTAIRYWKTKGLPVTKNRAGHPVIKKTVAESWKMNEQAA